MLVLPSAGLEFHVFGHVRQEIPRLDPQADRRGVQRLLDGQERIKENTQRIGERIPPDSP